jgi:hypothetical protein
LVENITATVLADSISRAGHRLITILCHYPRFLEAEVNMHRAFSRSAASNRAIPTKRVMGSVVKETVLPVELYKNEPGMSGREVIEDPAVRNQAWRLILAGRDDMLMLARGLDALGLHKDICNRYLESFQYIDKLITATDWDNFTLQRHHPDAKPEFGILAAQIVRAINNSDPVLVEYGKWHRPFGDKMLPGMEDAEMNMIAIARCARLSYDRHDGVFDPEDDIRLYEKLREHSPPHWGPFEHVASPTGLDRYSANLWGWEHRRFQLEPDEYVVDTRLKDKPGWVRTRPIRWGQQT